MIGDYLDESSPARAVGLIFRPSLWGPPLGCALFVRAGAAAASKSLHNHHHHCQHHLPLITSLRVLRRLAQSAFLRAPRPLAVDSHACYYLGQWPIGICGLCYGASSPTPSSQPYESQLVRLSLLISQPSAKVTSHSQVVSRLLPD